METKSFYPFAPSQAITFCNVRSDIRTLSSGFSLEKGALIMCYHCSSPDPRLYAAKHWEAAMLPVILEGRKCLQSFHVFLRNTEIQHCIVFHVRGVCRFGKRD